MKPSVSGVSTPLTLTNVSTYDAGITQSTAHRLLKQFTDECLQEYNLTTMQWFIIGTIYDAGEAGITMTSLSRRLGTNVPYITNSLNKLEARNIIRRTLAGQGDGRSKVAHIHPSYVATVATVETSLRQKMRSQIYADIRPDELRVYIGVLMKLSHSLARFE